MHDLINTDAIRLWVQNIVDPYIQQMEFGDTNAYTLEEGIVTVVDVCYAQNMHE